MGRRTVAETIRDITRKHLEENNGLLLGQSISAVGWVNGTVPDCKGIVELPMADVAGAGIAVGAALVGRRPIFVLRFQNFFMLNGSPIINYAAITKSLHGKAAPIFVRSIATEYLGCVHSGVLHSLPMHFPGMLVCAPMTPGEYEQCWDVYIKGDDPIYVSEHKASFQNTEEIENIIRENADITLYAISSPRFFVKEAVEKLAVDGIICNVIHLFWLKPLNFTDAQITPLKQTKLGLVIDSGHEICGASRDLAYELTDRTGCMVKALGLEDSTKFLCHPHQNIAPDVTKIVDAVKSIVH